MTDFQALTSADASDPSIDPLTLKQIAEQRPDLWPAVLANPQCYPGLAEWIRAQMPAAPAPPVAAQPGAAQPSQADPTGAASADPPVAQQPAEPHATAADPSLSQQVPQQPEAAPQQPTAYPTPQQPAPPQRSGDPAQPAGAERPQQDPSAQQMSDAAKQFASGAKDFFNARVAPAAKNAARQVQETAQQQKADPKNVAGWVALMPLVMAAAAFLSIISLFLPIATFFGMSLNFFDSEAGGEGVLLLIAFLVVIAAAIAELVVRKTWSRITAGVLGILVGALGAFDGFGTMANLSGVTSPGAGVVMLAIFSTILLLASVILLLQNKIAARPSA